MGINGSGLPTVMQRTLTYSLPVTRGSSESRLDQLPIATLLEGMLVLLGWHSSAAEPKARAFLPYMNQDFAEFLN